MTPERRQALRRLASEQCGDLARAVARDVLQLLDALEAAERERDAAREALVALLRFAEDLTCEQDGPWSPEILSARAALGEP